jgi:uncharacterized protein (DUF488 family)
MPNAQHPMPFLFTVGTTRKSLRRFVELLREAKVDGVIDTRRNNTSQLAGFAKKEDLDFLLTEGFGIRYEHLPELAPSEPLLAKFLKDKDWDRYSMAFLDEMDAGRMQDTLCGLLDRYERPCLLCACDQESTCHRRLLAEALQEERPELEVRHLR